MIIGSIVLLPVAVTPVASIYPIGRFVITTWGKPTA